MSRIQLVECPRDAIQGWPHSISTDDKVAYYKTLLDVGFDVLDLGSFVSHRTVPQMADTGKVLRRLEHEGAFSAKTRVLVIAANERGVRDAVEFEPIDDIGFPFSISESFQQRNTGSGIHGALERLDRMNDLCATANKSLVIYISMGFGNPYGDEWSPQLLVDWAGKLAERYAPSVLSLSDTVGQASEATVKQSFEQLIPAHPSIIFGAHLHASPLDGLKKIKAAYEGGCFRFDGALRGVGGCPMAQDELVGNMAMESLVQFFGNETGWRVQDDRAWSQAQSIASGLFME